jgi:predicted Fe-S protein YdhL (DUF1289 family)
MYRLLTVLFVSLLIAGCLRTDRLRPGETGVWIGVKDTSYEKVWKAANAVMARRLSVTESDREMGKIVGQDNKGSYLWNETVGFFVWPTDNSDAGYSVDVGKYIGSIWRETEKDWKKIIIQDLKKELGAS